MAQLDTDNDDKVSLEELKAYYGDKAQVAPLQIVSGRSSRAAHVEPCDRRAAQHLGAKDGSST